MNNTRSEFGDWQTPLTLAYEICHTLKKHGFSPTTLIEPTCGRGNFIKAALEVFDDIKCVYAIEIHKPYIDEIRYLQTEYPCVAFYIYNQSVFDFDFRSLQDENLLLIGNPPWVTNSYMSSIGGGNLPTKSNIKKYKGLEAMTGKSNFDISEFIMLSLIEALANRQGQFAFLLKNSVIRNLVYGKITDIGAGDFSQYKIDAQKEFGASADASLFIGKLNTDNTKQECQVYNFYTQEYLHTFGRINNLPVSDIASYQKYAPIDGCSPFVWRSGIKHDCSKVMELSKDQLGNYINGLCEDVSIEEDLLYPLAKSSDISKKDTTHRKYVLITQRKTSDDTLFIRDKFPKTYNYLKGHRLYLDARKSSIYKNRPPYCIFGVGDYSFYPYKVAISSLYRSTLFTLLRPINGKPIMIDDTCYSIGFMNEEAASITLSILNSSYVQNFINSISNNDSKRIITKELLMRIDILEALSMLTNKELDITETQRLKYTQHIIAQSTDIRELKLFS